VKADALSLLPEAPSAHPDIVLPNAAMRVPADSTRAIVTAELSPMAVPRHVHITQITSLPLLFGFVFINFLNNHSGDDLKLILLISFVVLVEFVLPKEVVTFKLYEHY
jgi:hypothetical protein